jgi:hydrogenase expression/formation protein HypC
MCLAIPGKITSIKNNHGMVDFDGIQKEINLSLVKAKKGDYVIVHAGFAISKIEDKEAEEISKIVNHKKKNV